MARSAGKSLTELALKHLAERDSARALLREALDMIEEWVPPSDAQLFSLRSRISVELEPKP